MQPKDETQVGEPAEQDQSEAVAQDQTTEAPAAPEAATEPTWESRRAGMIKMMADKFGIDVSDLTHNFTMAAGEEPPSTMREHPLTKAVTGLFTYCGHPDPQAWLQDLEAAFTANPAEARVLLTQHLHRLLGRMDVYRNKSTILIRAQLSPSMEITDWLTTIEVTVVPYMIDNDLPFDGWSREFNTPAPQVSEDATVIQDLEVNEPTAKEDERNEQGT